MSGKYRTITEVYDFGPYVSKVILETGRSLQGAEPKAEDFTVHFKRELLKEDGPWPAYMGPKFEFPMEGDLKVTGAYVSDARGEAKADGDCITLEIYSDPRNGLNSIIRFDGYFNSFVKVMACTEMKKPLALAEGELPAGIYDEDQGNRILLGEYLTEAEHEDPELSLRYVYYDPKTVYGAEVGAKIPLIIWLHGAGEGGQDTAVSAVGNKVVNLISPEIQAYFGGHTYLLSPQAPSMWMDDGSGQYTKDGTSMYTEPMERLIADFVAAHPDIDEDRIYIGGDSNGGYMTVNMVIRNPERYAAAFPVCEAFADKWIDAEKLARLAQVPIWFTACVTDPIVPVKEYATPTYLRLKEMGAEAHYTLWDSLPDTTGKYKNEDGTPYEYMGHWSWVPMLNDQCRLDFDKQPVKIDGKEVTLLQWVSQMKRHS